MMTGHSHWKLASAILSTGKGKESEGDLAELIAKRRWHQVIQYKDWAPDQDVKEYHVIRCPDDPRSAIVVVVSLAAMWSDDYTQSTIVLDVEDTKRILELAGDQWEPF